MTAHPILHISEQSLLFYDFPFTSLDSLLTLTFGDEGSILTLASVFVVEPDDVDDDVDDVVDTLSARSISAVSEPSILLDFVSVSCNSIKIISI